MTTSRCRHDESESRKARGAGPSGSSGLGRKAEHSIDTIGAEDKGSEASVEQDAPCTGHRSERRRAHKNRDVKAVGHHHLALRE